MTHTHTHTHPEFEDVSLLKGLSKRKQRSSSNHHSEAMLNFGGVASEWTEEFNPTKTKNQSFNWKFFNEEQH